MRKPTPNDRLAKKVLAQMREIARQEANKAIDNYFGPHHTRAIGFTWDPDFTDYDIDGKKTNRT